MNLDLDFIDFPTGWAIQKSGRLDGRHHPRCSAVSSEGALLCDCDALPFEWAVLKTNHDGSNGMELAGRYFVGASPTTPINDQDVINNEEPDTDE